MELIGRSIWSHNTTDSKSKQSVAKIRESRPKPVATYEQLINAVALISYNNPGENLYYRGQGSEHVNSANQTTLLPSIYRSLPPRGKGREVGLRFERLAQAEELLYEEFERRGYVGHDKLERFPEVRWSVLQHYGVCPTPLLDVTSSLRVACSFATHGSSSRTGVVYLLGLPQVSGSISYYVEEEALNVKLLSSCPPEARRPYYQQGYLVGTFPSRQLGVRGGRIDVARRLVAKFEITIRGFWDDAFRRIPHDALFPPSDEIEDVCSEVANRIGRS